jgi:hypothetical protein
MSSTLPQLLAGTFVFVKYGTEGTQLAYVLTDGPLGVQVRKYRRATGRWTKPLHVPRADVVGAASPVELVVYRRHEAEQPAPGRYCPGVCQVCRRTDAQPDPGGCDWFDETRTICTPCQNGRC